METTYGNRVHPSNSLDVTRLMDIIRDTAKRGGTTVIPSFAVGRTQELIYELNRVYDSDSEYHKDFENLMVYVDSPMATTATEVFKRNAQVFDDETKAYITKGDNPLDFKNLKFTRTSQESMWLNSDPTPKVIISASGMCDAGRIRHHLKHNLWNRKSSIIFVGYQAEGTLGRLLLDGAKEVTLFGENVQVNAQIHNLEGFSGHADKDGLFAWLSGFQTVPKHVFLVHGEEESKKAFAYTVKEKLGYDPIVVTEQSEYILEKDEIVDSRIIENDGLQEEIISNTQDTLTDIHSRIEDILYNAKLAVGKDISPAKMTKINNLVMELEKSTINLGAVINEEDRDKNPAEGLA